MRKIFSFKCQKCGEVHESLCEDYEIKEIEKNNKCQLCGGDLKRVWTFGYGIFKGSGFTKRST